MAKLKVRRSSEWMNRARKVGVYIDGTKVGTIRNGRSAEFEVPPGQHKVQAKIDWCGSQPITVNVDPEETKEVKLSGLRHSNTVIAVMLVLVSAYWILRFGWDIDWFILIVFTLVVALYPMYFVFIDRDRYLIITE